MAACVCKSKFRLYQEEKKSHKVGKKFFILLTLAHHLSLFKDRNLATFNGILIISLRDKMPRMPY